MVKGKKHELMPSVRLEQATGDQGCVQLVDSLDYNPIPSLL